MSKQETDFASLAIIALIVAVIVMKITGIITLSWVVLITPVLVLFLAAALIGALVLVLVILRGLASEYKERKNERN